MGRGPHGHGCISIGRRALGGDDAQTGSGIGHAGSRLGREETVGAQYQRSTADGDLVAELHRFGKRHGVGAGAGTCRAGATAAVLDRTLRRAVDAALQAAHVRSALERLDEQIEKLQQALERAETHQTANVLRAGLERDYPDSVPAFDTINLEFAYYGDLANACLEAAGQEYDEVLDIGDRRNALMALRDIKARKRFGIKPLERAPAREGTEIFIGDEKVGVVTSGGFGPPRPRASQDMCQAWTGRRLR